MNNFQYIWSLLFTFGPSLYISLAYKWWWGIVSFILIMVVGGIINWGILLLLGPSKNFTRPYFSGPLYAIISIVIAHYLWTK